MLGQCMLGAVRGVEARGAEGGVDEEAAEDERAGEGTAAAMQKRRPQAANTLTLETPLISVKGAAQKRVVCFLSHV